MQYAEMRGNMNMYQQIKEEMDNLSTGQMINMYEVHVRDLAEYPEEKIEQLKLDISKTLGLTGGEEIVVMDQQGDQEMEMPEERLMAVMQDPTVCLITRDL